MKKILVLAVSLLLFSGCNFIDGLHQFNSGKSTPAYPSYIADQPVYWTEGGHTSLIDKTGVHELK